MWLPTFHNYFSLFERKPGGFALLFILLVHAQEYDDQSGFISIDCGLADSYSEKTTGINYISDANLTDTGEINWILAEHKDSYPQMYDSLRSFPQGRRNCYRIDVTNATKYLIRASFLYGNYDRQNKLPEFQLHLGPNLWDTVSFKHVSTPTHKELIHYVPALQNYINVCLVNTGSGVPFISALELRPLPNSTYPEQKSNSLALISRYDAGSSRPYTYETGSNRPYRYPDDKLDRFWYVYNRTDWSQLNTTNDMNSSNYSSQPPSIVMKNAATPKNQTGSLDFFWEKDSADKNAKYLYYLHFAEVEKLPPNQSRLQYISKDGELFHEPFALSYLETTNISWSWSLTQNTTLSISKANNSTLPPILNAFEIYLVKEFLVLETNQKDVDEITLIKSTNKIKKNWQGDPCVPREYQWEGVNCGYPKNERPTIKSYVLEQDDWEKKRSNIKIVAVVGSLLIILLIIVAVLWGFERKRQREMMMKNSIPKWSLESEGQHFKYSELVKITNNFATIIGSGGFGKVYHGTLKDGIQVAVKLLTSSSGSKEFQNEVKLLMRAHHRNLVSLIGHCYERGTMALVFEYVTNGTLQQHISATTENLLTWKERLQIAVDAAQGLEYLHNGCKPPIVHRDLKTSNVLLNEKMQAKICDFGISKVLSTESATHTQTDHIKGTRGYFDPEYYTTGNLNKKSDLYSFGIVLLELITGRPAIITNIEDEPIHICQWARPKFERKEIESIVDSRIQGTYNNSSAWKAIEVAMACVASTSIQRPDIIVVYNELQECLKIEVPPEVKKMPEIIEESDESICYSDDSVYIMSHIKSETEIYSN